MPISVANMQCGLVYRIQYVVKIYKKLTLSVILPFMASVVAMADRVVRLLPRPAWKKCAKNEKKKNSTVYCFGPAGSAPVRMLGNSVNQTYG
jgi:hypothetical protein